MTKLSAVLIGLAVASASAFTAPAASSLFGLRPSASLTSSSTAVGAYPDVLVVGPSMLQLVVAKHLSQRSDFTPMVVAPQKTIDSYQKLVNDPSGTILKDALIGLPEESDGMVPGTFKGVVFTAEDPVLNGAILEKILSWKGFAPGFKCVVCAPISEFVNKEKKANWMPILNNDRKEEEQWRTFVDSVRGLDFASFNGCEGCFVRHGSLLGGGTDGADELNDLGLDEAAYKMSLEQYRDLRERSFDRYRLGAQILSGDAVNRQPPDQKDKEKKFISKEEDREAFCASGGYPEQDRTNRHTLASLAVHILNNGVAGDFEVDRGMKVEKEITVLSKCVSAIPGQEEWAQLISKPGPAQWPDPEKYVPQEKVEE